MNKGFTRKELPKSVDAYRKALRKHVAVHNGKLLGEFEDLYDELHIVQLCRNQKEMQNSKLQAPNYK